MAIETKVKRLSSVQSGKISVDVWLEANAVVSDRTNIFITKSRWLFFNQEKYGMVQEWADSAQVQFIDPDSIQVGLYFGHELNTYAFRFSTMPPSLNPQEIGKYQTSSKWLSENP